MVISKNLDRKWKRASKAYSQKAGFPFAISRQSSAFVVYFMKKTPENWLEIARDNDMAKDVKYRRLLAEEGIFHFPKATKQGSISFAHTEKDVQKTLEVTEAIVKKI